MHSLKWHFLQNIDKRYLHCYILSPFVWLRFSRVWTPVINIHRSWLIAVAGDPDNTPIYTSICSVLLVALKRSCSRFCGTIRGLGDCWSRWHWSHPGWNSILFVCHFCPSCVAHRNVLSRTWKVRGHWGEAAWHGNPCKVLNYCWNHECDRGQCGGRGYWIISAWSIKRVEEEDKEIF